MEAVPPSNSPIIAAFVARPPGSAAAYAEARHHFPGGVTHDALVGRRNLLQLRDTAAIAHTLMPPIHAPR